MTISDMKYILKQKKKKQSACRSNVHYVLKFKIHIHANYREKVHISRDRPWTDQISIL